MSAIAPPHSIKAVRRSTRSITNEPASTPIVGPEHGDADIEQRVGDAEALLDQHGAAEQRKSDRRPWAEEIHGAEQHARAADMRRPAVDQKPGFCVAFCFDRAGAAPRRGDGALAPGRPIARSAGRPPRPPRASRAASQRGDSGSNRNSTPTAAEPMAPRTSAQRQPSSPNGCSGVSQRIRKITAGAPRKPIAPQTRISMPRRAGGSTSER